MFRRKAAARRLTRGASRYLGAETPRLGAILGAVILLVAISPLGSEGTHPAVFFAYRTLLFAITVLCAIEVYQRKTLDVHPKFILAAMFLVFLMWISFQVNPGSKFDGRYAWYQLVLFGMAFLALAALNRDRPLRWKQVILGSIVTIDLIYLFVGLIPGQRPAAGSFVNANYFASFLLAGYSISLAAFLFARNVALRAACAGSAIILFYGMTAAWSRGAVLSAAAVSGFAVLRSKRKFPLRLAAGAVIFGILLLASSGLIRKFLDRGAVDPYNYARPQIWLGTLKMIAGYPLLGVGLAQFDPVSIRFSPPVEGTIGRYMKRLGIAHSEYLQFTAELGIPAALLLFGLAASVFSVAIREARECESEFRVFFQEAAILTAAGLGAHALVDNNWRVPVMAAGLVVFSAGNVLPFRTWNRRIDWSRPKLALIIMAASGMYLQSTVIPSTALAFNEIGHRAFVAEDLDRAETFHRLAAGIAPDSPVLLENAGLVYFNRYVRTRDRRFLDDAEMFYSRAIAADPNAPSPRRNLEKSLIQRLTGNPDKDLKTHLQIIDVDREILKIDPFNPFVRANLAEALYNVGDHKAAEQELAKAVELEPNYVPGHLRLAEWYEKSGDIPLSEIHRSHATSITARYQHVTRIEPYEALLLGRTAAGWSDEAGK